MWCTAWQLQKNQEFFSLPTAHVGTFQIFSPRTIHVLNWSHLETLHVLKECQLALLKKDPRMHESQAICVATFLTLFFFPGMVKRWRLSVNMRLSMWYYYTGERAVFSTWMISLFPSSPRRRPVCKKRKSKVEKLVKSVSMLIATQVELCFCSWMLKDQSLWEELRTKDVNAAAAEPSFEHGKLGAKRMAQRCGHCQHGGVFSIAVCWPDGTGGSWRDTRYCN